MMLAIVALMGLSAAGCQKQPLVSELPRTPYERYMALRGRERPATHRDHQGLEQRNVRERLRPLEY